METKIKAEPTEKKQKFVSVADFNKLTSVIE